MKRFWLGVMILAGLLALGIGVTVAVNRFCDPISGELSQASDAVLQDQWAAAEQAARRARSRWERHRALHAAVGNHEPMEEIDSLFEQLEIYSRQRDGLRFAECCAQLASLITTLGEAQGVYWWNVL